MGWFRRRPVRPLSSAERVLIRLATIVMISVFVSLIVFHAGSELTIAVTAGFLALGWVGYLWLARVRA